VRSNGAGTFRREDGVASDEQNGGVFVGVELWNHLVEPPERILQRRAILQTDGVVA